MMKDTMVMTDEPYKLLLITPKPDRRVIPEVTPWASSDIWNAPKASGALVEPVFLDFKAAGDNELGFPFQCIQALAPKVDRLSLVLSYSLENAKAYKGYLLDIQDQMKANYAKVVVQHVPYVNCGAPMQGSVVVITGAQEAFGPKVVAQVVTPQDVIPDLIAHVMTNRPNYQLSVSSRAIGAVRSDRNMLPAPSAWNGRSLMVEYQDGVTTKLLRLRNKDVGEIFGTKPAQYTDAMRLMLPAAVVRAFL